MDIMRFDRRWDTSRMEILNLRWRHFNPHRMRCSILMFRMAIAQLMGGGDPNQAPPGGGDPSSMVG